MSTGKTTINSSEMSENESTIVGRITDIQATDTSYRTKHDTGMTSKDRISMSYTPEMSENKSTMLQREKNLARTMPNGVTPGNISAMTESKSTNVDTISETPSADKMYRTTHIESTSIPHMEKDT